MNVAVLDMTFARWVKQAKMADGWHGNLARGERDEALLDELYRIRYVEGSIDFLPTIGFQQALLCASSLNCVVAKYSLIFSRPGSR